MRTALAGECAAGQHCDGVGLNDISVVAESTRLVFSARTFGSASLVSAFLPKNKLEFCRFAELQCWTGADKRELLG